MIFALIIAALLSAATGYLIGYRVIAPRDSFWRSKVGMWVLIALGLTFLILPPQLTALDDVGGMLWDASSSSIVQALALPAGFDASIYVIVWIVSTLLALLAGMRIWNMRDPDWRPAAEKTVESAATRARGLLPLAESLDDVLATLSAAPLSSRDIEFLGPQLLLAGARFGAQLPQKRSDAFQVVARRVSPAIATRVTELLQQGAAGKAGG